MKKLLLGLFFVFVFVSSVYAVIIGENVTFSPSSSAANFTVPVGQEINATNVTVNRTSLIVVGGDHEAVYYVENLTAPSAYSGEITSPYVDVLNHTNTTNINATLTYNNTAYSTNATGAPQGIYTRFTTQVTAPIVDATKNIAYHWAGVIETASEATLLFDIFNNQQVDYYLVDNCTGGSDVALILNIFDEDIPENSLNASLELYMEYWVNTQASAKNYSNEFTGDYSYNVCINSTVDLRYDMYVQQTTDNGFTHRYYVYNGSITSTDQNISLYNFNLTADPTSSTSTTTTTVGTSPINQTAVFNATTNTTVTTGLTGGYATSTSTTTPIVTSDVVSDLKITVRNKNNYQYLENVVAKLQRKYIAEGSIWRTVQMDKSGDYGQLFFNVHEENTDYRLIFTDTGNNILATTQSMKMVCEDQICDITYLLEPYAATISKNLTTSITFNNITKIVTATWEDLTGKSYTVRTIISKDTMKNTTNICDQSSTASSGTHTCNVSAYTGTIIARMTSSNSDAVNEIVKTFEIVSESLQSYLGVKESGFWAFGITTTTVMFGAIINPIGAVLGLMVGLMFVYFIGLMPVLNLPILIIIFVLGIAISIKVKR